MQSESNKLILKKENNYLIQWMASDLRDINSNKRITQIFSRWAANNSEPLKTCRLLGLGSMVLKAIKLNLEISRSVFNREYSRITYGGNLGWSKNDSLKMLKLGKDQGLLKKVPEDLINKFESDIKKDKEVLKLSKSIVWFPIVDLKTDMVMFDACYSNKKGVSSCYASAGITTGSSNELALLIQEFISKNYANRSICLQFVATGTLTMFGITKKIGKVDKIIPKLKAALDFGIPDIFAPLENKEECVSCKDIFNHSKYSCIHWVSDIDEVKKYIHQQFNDIYSVNKDNIDDDKDRFALQTYEAKLSGRQGIKDKDFLKFNTDTNTDTNINTNINNENRIKEFENRLLQIKENIINKDIKSAYLGYEELEKDYDKLLLEDDNRFFKTKYYKIKCLYYLFEDKELYTDEKFTSELEVFVSRFEKSKRIINLRLIYFFSLVCKHYINQLFRNLSANESFDAIYKIFKRITNEDDKDTFELFNCWVDTISIYGFKVIHNGTVDKCMEHGELLFKALPPDNPEIKERLIKTLVEMGYFANDFKLSNKIESLLEDSFLNNDDTFIKNIRELLGKNNILDEVVSKFRHETKSTLGNINQCIKNIDEVLLNKSESINQSQIQYHCDRLKSNVQYLVSIMDFISNKKPSGNDYIEITLKELIDDYTKNSRQPNIFKIKTLSDNNDFTFPIVKNYFFIALNNLINNSLEAYEENNIDENKRQIEFIIDYSQRRLIIQDHAGGIKVKDRNKIFDPYFSTKNSDKTLTQSRGLGMTQIKNALALMNYSFGFASEQPSDGTAFYIQF